MLLCDMDNAWSISLTEHDDIMLRNGDLEGDCGFRIFLCSNLDGEEQEFQFFIPAREIETYSRGQKMDLFNKAVDVVLEFAGTELRNDSITEYQLQDGRFQATPSSQDDIFSYKRPHFLG